LNGTQIAINYQPIDGIAIGLQGSLNSEVELDIQNGAENENETEIETETDTETMKKKKTNYPKPKPKPVSPAIVKLSTEILLYLLPVCSSVFLYFF